jgi:hypothetical protein
MSKNSEYYLKPGTTIGASGLPGGKISADKKPVYISEEHAEIIGKSLDYLVSAGKVGKGAIKEDTETETENNIGDDSSKSEKRIALEIQAKELGIEFTDRTTQKELAALIDAKLAE